MSAVMTSTITRRGVAMTVGQLPPVGSYVPALSNLIKKDWTIFQSTECADKYIILNIYPSLDTPTCAKTVKHFNEHASKFSNTIVLCISKDLPPALSRFCGAENIGNVVALSAYRSDCDFGTRYGITITDGAGAEGAFKDLFARALIAINPQGRVIYSELVPELANEPNYNACLQAIQAAELQIALSNTAANPNPNASSATAFNIPLPLIYSTSATSNLQQSTSGEKKRKTEDDAKTHNNTDTAVARSSFDK